MLYCVLALMSCLSVNILASIAMHDGECIEARSVEGRDSDSVICLARLQLQVDYVQVSNPL
jgi:hypothetical protein